MFDRTSYDRTLYSRSSEFDYVEATLRGTSELNAGVVTQVYLDAFTLKGSGNLTSSIIARQMMPISLTGESGFKIDDFRLRLRLATSMSGGTVKYEGIQDSNGSYILDSNEDVVQGSIVDIPYDAYLGVGVRVPFEVNLSGLGDAVKYEGIQDSNGSYILDSNEDVVQGSIVNTTLLYFLQHMNGHLKGSGNLTSSIILPVYLSSLMEGNSKLTVNDKFKFPIQMNVSLAGIGNLEPHRIGDLNSDTLEFDNLNLKPGQTMIINTDELDVFIDNIFDVSSVTSDSVFFSLQPGENEITFVSNVNPNLTVTFIWQNRWL